MNKKLISIFIKNFTNLSLNQGINIVITLIITPFLFQRLGESQYGFVNLSFSIVILLAIIVSYGYNLNGPQKIAVYKSDLEKFKFLSQVITLRLFIASILFSIIVLSFYLLGIFKNYWIILFPSLLILFSEALFPLFYLQGKDKLNTLMILNACSKIMYLIFIFISIKDQNDAYLTNLLFGFSSLIVYFFFWISLLYKQKPYWFKFNFLDIVKSLNKNFNLFLSSIGSQIIVNGGIIILSNFITSSELGQFSLAQRVGLLLRMVPTFLVQSVLQSASRLNISNKKNLLNYLNKVYSLGLIITLLFGIALIFISKWVIYILAGEFISYSENILILLGFIPFVSMLNFKNLVLILVNHKSELLNKAIWISAFLMIIFSTIGSFLYGGYGLAFSLIFSELVCFFIHSYLLKKETL
ncbi:oligosaccharide flippase family protein [Flavobacteriaceae bacterium]|nr:oligosaccharide flippase family protein [Flavobacteriaceae bacterium]